MPIWVICRRVEGYTLLELLVVLLIIGLLTSLAAPRLLTAYTRLHAAYERDEVFSRLAGLGYQAYREGRDFELTVYPSVDNPPPLELPPGWQVRADAPIAFRRNGACEGGTASLIYQEQSYRIQLAPPFCQPRLY